VTTERPGKDELDTPERIYGRLIAAAGTPAANAGDASEGSAPPNERRVLAVIWATVDRERVLAGLDVAAERLAEDPHLGASVSLVRPADGDPIAILEPVTEGRLAATLARQGEGPAGESVEAPLPHEAIGRVAAAAGLVIGRPADGPFGRSVLVLPRRPGGPHLVLVEPSAGTIGR
jgi:hypothetical protein